MNFDNLSIQIKQVHETLYKSAVKAVNTHITIRNWIIGFYIVEFEQNGSDRAEYGAKLLSKLASTVKIKGLTAPELSRCRQFYNTYPQIPGSVTQEFKIIELYIFSQNPLIVHQPGGLIENELNKR